MLLSVHPTPLHPARLLLVDDHPVMRHGLSELLSLEPDLSVAGQAASGADAIALLRVHNFDLVIADVSLGGLSGLDLLREIRARWPRLPVLMFSMHDESLYAERSLRAGASGFLSKQASPDFLVAGIRNVLAGQLCVSEEVRNRVFGPATDAMAGSEEGGTIDLLSHRELEVFQFIGRGRGTREIAREMHVSVKTVETHRAHIKKKFKLKTAPELMRFAVDWMGRHGHS